MKEKNEVKIDIRVDPAPMKPGFEEGLRQQKEFQDRWARQEADAQAKSENAKKAWALSPWNQVNQAKKEAEAQNHAAREFVERLKDQAATLGFTRLEMERYRSTQIDMTAEQRKSVDMSLAKIDANQREQESLEKLTKYALRAAAVVSAAMVTGFTLSVRAAEQAERSVARFEAMWRGTGMTSGLSRDQLSDMVDQMQASTPHTDEQIRDSMSVLMAFRHLHGETFREAMQLSAGLAEVMGGDLKSAVSSVGRALEDPVAGLRALRSAGVLLMDHEREAIKVMIEHGDRAGALQVVLAKLKEAGFDKVTDSVYKKGGYTNAIGEAAKATGELLEAIGGMRIVKSPVVEVLDQIKERATGLKRVIEDGDWKDVLIMLASGVTPGPGAEMLKGAMGYTGPKGRPAADPDSPEARAAREAAGEHSWQTGYDAYQANLKEIADKADKAAEKQAERGGGGGGRGARAGKVFDHDAELRRIFGEPQPGEVQAAEEAVRAAEELIYTWDEAGNRIAISKREFADLGKEASESFQRIGESGTEAFDDMKNAIDDSGRELSRMLARGEVGFRSLTEVASRFGEELLAIQIQKQIMDPLLKGATGYLDNLFNSQQGYGFGADGRGAFDAELAPEGHTGGIVRRDGIGSNKRRYVHPAYFENAPRFHGGGEVPAILKIGEEVLTRRDPRHRANGGSVPAVTVNVINQTGQPVQAQASAPRVDASGMVVDLVLRGLSTNAGAREQLGGMLKGPTNY